MGSRHKKKRRASSGSSEAGLEGESVEERAKRLAKENAALRKQVARLEEDRTILKKAAAFFAKESE